jgi:hypothetical protein
MGMQRIRTHHPSCDIEGKEKLLDARLLTLFVFPYRFFEPDAGPRFIHTDRRPVLVIRSLMLWGPASGLAIQGHMLSRGHSQGRAVRGRARKGCSHSWQHRWQPPSSQANPLGNRLHGRVSYRLGQQHRRRHERQRRPFPLLSELFRTLMLAEPDPFVALFHPLG